MKITKQIIKDYKLAKARILLKELHISTRTVDKKIKQRQNKLSKKKNVLDKNK